MENIKKYTYYISDLHFNIGSKNYIISDSVGDSFICRITNNSDSNNESFSHTVVHKSDIKRFLEIENAKELSVYEMLKLEEFFGKGFFENCTENIKVYSGSVKGNFNKKTTQPNYIFSIKGKHRIAVWDNDDYISYQITPIDYIYIIHAKGWATKTKEIKITSIVENNKYDMTLSQKDGNLFYRITEMPIKNNTDENIQDSDYSNVVAIL